MLLTSRPRAAALSRPRLAPRCALACAVGDSGRELFQRNGADGVERVLAARNGDGQDLAFAVFDVLTLDGRDTMSEPWERRRARLESVVSRPGKLARAIDGDLP